jgi:hypothetical protein
MYNLTVSEEWNSIHPRDLWVYNKLQLSQTLGYTCGPAGLEVPKSGFYIVRPIMNFMGMGRYAREEFIKRDTEYLHPGEFWCEVFDGEHLSVDYFRGESSLVVIGKRKKDFKFYKWDSWEKTDRKVEFPELLNPLKDRYDWINCEFIDGKLIEVQFRRNPDFRFGNSIAIPVWKEDPEPTLPEGTSFRYIEEMDYKRKGFIID